MSAESLTLDSQQIGQFWQQLPYWAFAWAAGQGLAHYILANPEFVQGKRVLDFGCGSGLVGIAAAKAGAKSVVCCDTDPLALIATKHNALRNGVEINTLERWAGDSSDLDCLLAADILYDLTSAGDLASQCANIPSWLVAETQYQLPPWSSLIAVEQYLVSTLPKLEDFDQDLAVSIYRYNKAI
jgi:predicted nicotinamide N-methyase